MVKILAALNHGYEVHLDNLGNSQEVNLQLKLQKYFSQCKPEIGKNIPVVLRMYVHKNRY